MHAFILRPDNVDRCSTRGDNIAELLAACGLRPRLGARTPSCLELVAGKIDRNPVTAQTASAIHNPAGNLPTEATVLQLLRQLTQCPMTRGAYGKYSAYNFSQMSHR